MKMLNVAVNKLRNTLIAAIIVIAFLLYCVAAMAQDVCTKTEKSSSSELSSMLLQGDASVCSPEQLLRIGNGRLVAAVTGAADESTIYVSDTTFNAALRAAALHQNAEDSSSVWLRPLAAIIISDIGGGGEAEQYCRRQCPDSAICRDSYVRDGVTYSRECFASDADNLIAVRLTASRRGALSFVMSLSSQESCRTSSSPQGQVTLTGHARADAVETTHFCVIARVVPDDGNVASADGTVMVAGATSAVVYLVGRTSWSGSDRGTGSQEIPYIEEAADDAWHTVNYTYEQFRNRHIAECRRQSATTVR